VRKRPAADARDQCRHDRFLEGFFAPRYTRTLARFSALVIVSVLAPLVPRILVQPLHAQDEDEVYESEIIVTGDRRERTQKDSITRTEVINRKEIERSGAQNAADALEHTPGIEIRRGIRGRSIRLQGLDPQYVLILVNGERITGRIDNAIDLTRIKAEEIERIEIVKGASSALYGSDAIGGVINIITRDVDRPAEAQADVSYGSGREANFGAGGETRTSGYVGLRNDFLSTATTVGWHRSDGYDLTPFTERDERALALTDILTREQRDAITRKQGRTGTAFTDVNVGNRSTFYVTDPLRIRTHGQFRRLEQSLVDTSPPRQLLERVNRTEDSMIGVSPILDLANDGRLRGSYNYSRFFDKLEQDQLGGDALDNSETQEERVQEGKLQLGYEWFDDHYITVGSDYILEELFSERIDEGYGFRERIAFFAQDEWTILRDPRWILTPGARYEEDSLFGSQTTPKLATRLDPNDRLVLRASAGAGFRAPSFKDLFFDFQNPGVGYQVIGNPDLEPEESVSYNAGLEYEPYDWLWLSFNAYYNRITNLIDFRLLPTRQNDLATFQTQNIKEAYTRGVETSAEFSLTDSLRLGLGYALTDTRDIQQDIPLEGRARHRGVYRIDYEYRPWQTGVSVRGSVYGRQAYWRPRVPLVQIDNRGRILTDLNAPITALLENREVALFEPRPDFPQQSFEYRNPFHILDVRFYKRFGESYELYFGVDNLLDEYEPTLNPERPRFFYFGVTMRYAAERRDRQERWRNDFEQGLPIDRMRERAQGL